jgi:hypothetical protein
MTLMKRMLGRTSLVRQLRGRPGGDRRKLAAD